MKASLTVHGRRGAVDLDVELAWDAPVLALLGPSGAGKTSVLEALLGLWRPDALRVHLGGRALEGLPVERRGLGWVPQDLGLFPHLDVRGNLAFGARGPVEDVAERLGLSPLLGREVSALSGGERQRVALGRALCARPAALLLDEPLTGLDRPLRAQVLADLLALKQSGVPMIHVSHDLHEVWALADVVAVLRDGRVTAFGPVREVLASPTAADALAHAGMENVFAGVLEAVDGEPGLLSCRVDDGFTLYLPRFPESAEPGARVRVAVRAEDVVLAAGDPGPTSAQNVLEGEVVAVDAVARQRLVEIRVGEGRWRVQVTGRAVEALGLEAGRGVRLLVKAHAVQVVNPIPG